MVQHPEVRERNRRQVVLLIDDLRDRPRARILDVGCWYGQHRAELSAALPQVSLTGVDLSRSMLVSAREYLDGRPIRLIQADAARLPFRDGTFDVVITTGSVSFIHPRHVGAVFDELLRVARERIYHFERYRKHLKERLHQEAFDLSITSFPHDTRRSTSTGGSGSSNLPSFPSTRRTPSG